MPFKCQKDRLYSGHCYKNVEAGFGSKQQVCLKPSSAASPLNGIVNLSVPQFLEL